MQTKSGFNEKNQYSIVELEMIYRFGFVALKNEKKRGYSYICPKVLHSLENFCPYKLLVLCTC